MNEAGLIVAIFISAIFVISAFFACIGPIGDFGGVEIETDGFDVGDFISFKGLLHFMFGFSWSWAVFGLDTTKCTLLAVGIGVVCVVLLGLIYKWLMKLEPAEKTQEPIQNLKDRVGTVYSIITDKDGEYMYVGTILRDDTYSEFVVFSNDKFDVGDKFIVESVINDKILIKKQ